MDACKIYEHPKIVIGIPVFNESKFIEKTLCSLASQSETDFLVVISDNCSEDGTSETCRKFCDKDDRFKYVRHSTNIGSSGNFEFLYRNTISPYFMWLGAHDYIDINYLAIQIAALETYKGIGLAYSRSIWIDQDDIFIKETDGGDFVRNDDDGLIRYLNTINCRWGECTAIYGVFRRSVLNGVRFFQFPGPDHWILTRIQYFGKCYRTELPIYYRREVSGPRLDYMHRVLGDDIGKRKSNIWVSKMWPLAIEQTKDYHKLPEPLYRKVLYFPILLLNLELGYGLIFKFYGRLASKYMKKLWFNFN